MADRPILFSAPMVRALTAGTKVQTRRLIDFKGIDEVMDFVKVATDPQGRPVYEMKGRVGQHIAIPAGKHLQDYNWSPRIGIGDRLYVREEFSGPFDFKPKVNPPTTWPVGCDIWYWADGNPEYGDWNKPKRAMHMPRWMSRLTLTVNDVRIERLQDISETDAMAEGIERANDHPVFKLFRDYCALPKSGTGAIPAVDSYRSLWDSINGTGAWAANPWVVAYTFSVQHGNIDQIAQVAA